MLPTSLMSPNPQIPFLKSTVMWNRAFCDCWLQRWPISKRCSNYWNSSVITEGIQGPVYFVTCSSAFKGNAVKNEVNGMKRQREICQNFVPDVDEIISRQLANSWGLAAERKSDISGARPSLNKRCLCSPETYARGIFNNQNYSSITLNSFYMLFVVISHLW